MCATPRDFLNIGGNPVFNYNYIWDQTGIAYSSADGTTPIATGRFRVMTPSDLGSNNPYTSTITGVSATGQVIIPAGAKRWEVQVISGAVFVKGSGPLFAGAVLKGGGFDGTQYSASTIAVGGTGSAATAANAIVTWDA